MAFIMETLGFQVQAEPGVVQSVRDYKGNMQASYRFGEAPRVFLVMMNGEETDPMPVKHTPHAQDSPKPQIVMMRGIPWIAFRHFRGTSDEVDTQYLVDVWRFSFPSSKECFRRISMLKQSIQIEIEPSEVESVPEHHKLLISDFSPELERICGAAIRHFIPMLPHSPGWNISEIKEHMRVLRTEEERFLPRPPCRGNCYVLYAIVAGAIYGLCSNAYFDNGDSLSEDSEVAFIPDIIYENAGQRLGRWARTLGHSLRGHHVALQQWSELLFEIFLGKDTESGSLVASSRNIYINQQNPYRERLFLGAQANGLTAVSDMLVTTTTGTEAFCYFHIKRGQILSFPLTEDYYIQASSYLELASTLDKDPEPNNSTLRRFERGGADFAIRIDVEPCWKEDPRTVLFMGRAHGVPIATLNISTFLDRMSYQAVQCNCLKPVWEVPVPVGQRWQCVTLYQLKRTKYQSIRRVNVNGPDNRILIDASQSMAATIFAVCILHVRQLSLASSCLACAYQDAMRNGHNAGATVIIPYKEAW